MAKNKIWWGILFRVLSVLTMLTPMIVLFYVNRARYLTTTTRTSSSIAFGVVIALALVIFIIVRAFKHVDRFAQVFICLAVSLVVLWGLAEFGHLLLPIIKDMWWVILCALIGFVPFWVFWKIADKLLENYKIYHDEKQRVQARREAQNEAEKQTPGSAVYM